jgi:hypothetical protein
MRMPRGLEPVLMVLTIFKLAPSTTVTVLSFSFEANMSSADALVDPKASAAASTAADQTAFLKAIDSFRFRRSAALPSLASGCGGSKGE